jgi:hypothetical protein
VRDRARDRAGDTLPPGVEPPRTATSAGLAWTIFAVVAAALAGLTLARWVLALAFDGPLTYGEGAVVNAGRLVARGLDPYGAPPAGTFVAANYPPLSFFVVALGDALGAFTPLRAVGVLVMVGVAGAIAWRARQSRSVALALAASFLALFPVQAWGSLARADSLAVGLTAFAVLLAGESWRRAAPAGALAALAIYAKPTAVLPLAAVGLFLVWRERRTALRVGASFLLAAGALLAVTLVRFDPEGVVTHVVRWNVLPYSLSTVALLLFVGVLALGAFAVLGALRADGRMRAYLVGAALVLALGGREGATINYLLDLCAASCLTLAARPQAERMVTPAALGAQLALAFGLVAAGALHPTGAWAPPERVALAADLAPTSTHLAEDSGVLLANGLEPVVDDLFLWSRLLAAGMIPDEITPRVREGEFATVIAEIPLDALDAAPAFERQRWPAALAAAVLQAYRLELAVRGHYRYVPIRGFAVVDPP